MNLTQLFKAIYTASKKSKIDVYVVGGYVRDRLLDKEKISKDIDFVVVGSGIKFAREFDATIKSSFSKTSKGTLIEFEDFDTARLVIKKVNEVGVEKVCCEVEFAGARSESYREKSRKPAVSPASLEEDLKRRDFTVNAMARKVVAGGVSKKIVDPHNGQEDIKNRMIRTPLGPNVTFSDDPLRMLRAARFASQLDFKIEELTYKAITDNRKRIKIVSKERIQDELFKILKTDKPSIGLWILFNTRLLHEFLPEIAELYGVEEIYGKGHKNNLAHTFKVVDNVATLTDKVILRYSALMHDVGKAGTKKFHKERGWTFDMHEHLGRKIVRQIGRRLRMSKDDTEYVAKLVRWHQQPIALMDEGVTDSPVRRLIVNLEDDLDDLMILCRSDITTGNPRKLKKRLKNYDYLEKRIVEVKEKDNLRAFQSPFRGEEIMETAGLRPGPTVGKIKKAIEDAILDGEIPNEYEFAKDYFKKIKNGFLKDAEDWEKK